MSRVFPVSRTLAFVGLTSVCLLVSIGYVTRAAMQLRSQRTIANLTTSGAAVSIDGSPATGPQLLFRSTNPDSSHGRVMLAPLEGPEANRKTTPITGELVYFAGGCGVTLMADRGVHTTYSAALFHSDFQMKPPFPLAGIPSRARVSTDGRYVAITVFVSGHSYAGTNFSTATTLIDSRSGATIANLEEFKIIHGGVVTKAPRANFWGVTFARESNRFYATLSMGGVFHLVEGNIAERTVRTLRPGVECPSISPDNTRVVYKKRESPNRWRLHVLDLATFKDKALQETRSVNDQVEWLDNDHVLYALSNESGTGGPIESVWMVAVDGQGEARIFANGASSPVVVR